MKQCPRCKHTEDKTWSDIALISTDEIIQELARREKTSDLCHDCLLEGLVEEIGTARLKQAA